MYLVTADEMRKMDQDTIENFGLPGRLLMENAGRGATRMLIKKFPEVKGKKVGIAAGSGNNGGDGFVIARCIKEYGADVTVFVLSETKKIRGDAKTNLNLLSLLDIPVYEIPDKEIFEKHQSLLAQQEIWVDAILGTGLRSEVNGFFHHVIQFINNSQTFVFAVDIPSGLDSDTGQPHGVSIQADATATFGFAKTGHMLYPGTDYTGELCVVDIGIPTPIVEAVSPKQRLLTSESVRNEYQPRFSNAHKGTTGHLFVIAGSPGKTGAAALTSLSAMRTGAGLVTLGIPVGLNPVLESQVREVMTLPLSETEDGLLHGSSEQMILAFLKDKKCLAIGPGLGTALETRMLFFSILQNLKIPVVIDADGINMLAENRKILSSVNVPVILTPHPGEMARLMNTTVGEIQKDRIAIARDFALEQNVHLVLKGAGTVIAHPDGTVYINPTGNPGMASGGMGDVLTGMIAGLLTQGYSPEAATHLGVWLHGSAADSLAREKGVIGFLASDVMEEIPAQISLLDGSRLKKRSSVPFLL
ncbi:MAG: NAD(P)H-hydrate dehydratase [Deltaproteobacteria bacterium]|nr:MAG: NAD(P)H-hydrate dehydratase [Deltaproteobacteria bacterium]